MYTKGFYIKDKIGNNAFSFNNRKNKKIWVPNLIKIDSFNKIKLQQNKDKVAFEDFDFSGKLSTNYGLENFYEIDYLGKKIYLFDNHNHALYFWYLARDLGLIKKVGNILYHIDEHADYRDSNIILEKTDLKNIWKYTNFSDINVGNYIIPAEKQGLIKKTIQIRNTQNLKDYLLNKNINDNFKNIILNLDLDFFEPNLDFIDYDLKKEVILDIFKSANIITISTSPFFIDQKLAIKVLQDLFKE